MNVRLISFLGPFWTTPRDRGHAIPGLSREGMARQNALRATLFVLFFTVGAAAMGVAVLCDELARYDRNQDLLARADDALDEIKALDADYDALLRELNQDPNLIKRLAPATLGTEPPDTNAIYPRARAAELAAARKSLTEKEESEPPGAALPRLLERIGEPKRRKALFVAGAGLVLLTLVCFWPRRSSPQPPDETAKQSRRRTGAV